MHRLLTGLGIIEVLCIVTPIYVSTDLPLDTMAAILADDIFKCIFLNENGRISILISMEVVPMSPIGNVPALVQVMAWR